MYSIYTNQVKKKWILVQYLYAIKEYQRMNSDHINSCTFLLIVRDVKCSRYITLTIIYGKVPCLDIVIYIRGFLR